MMNEILKLAMRIILLLLLIIGISYSMEYAPRRTIEVIQNISHGVVSFTDPLLARMRASIGFIRSDDV